MNYRRAWPFLGPSLLILGCSSSSSPGGQTDAGISGNSGGSSGSGGSAGATTGGATASGGATGLGGASTTDVCPSCGVGKICVEHQTEGGVLILADAGRCPGGRIPSSGPRATCDSPPSYECATLPAECTTAPGSTAIAHCTCARSLCQSADQCTDVSPTLMKCTLFAP